jgi:beta-mannosidase
MAEDIRQIDWPRLTARHSLQKELMDHWVGTAQPDLATLVEKSQAYQSEMNRFYIDRARRAKYAPNGGVVQFMFTDPNPAIQWSVLDYWRVPKRSYFALRDAFRPVYAFLTLSADRRTRGGRPIRIDAFAVNDTPDDLGVATLTLTILDAENGIIGEHRAAVRLEPDCRAAHCLSIDESPERPGLYSARLTMESPGDRFENVYNFTIA